MYKANKEGELLSLNQLIDNVKGSDPNYLAHKIFEIKLNDSQSKNFNFV